MLNFDLNNDAVFAGTTGNGADLAVVVGRDHRCLPPRMPSGKRLLTAYRTSLGALATGSTPAPLHHQEPQDMPMSERSRWQGQQRPASASRQTAAAVAPAMWAALRIQQAL